MDKIVVTVNKDMLGYLERHASELGKYFFDTKASLGDKMFFNWQYFTQADSNLPACLFEIGEILVPLQRPNGGELGIFPIEMCHEIPQEHGRLLVPKQKKPENKEETGGVLFNVEAEYYRNIRAEIAKDILCAMVSGGYYGRGREKEQASLAVRYADALIEKLKKGESV